MSATPPQPRMVYWISVADHMPDDEITVLGGTADDPEVDLVFHLGRKWFRASDPDFPVYWVTHWMDLPEGPTS